MMKYNYGTDQNKNWIIAENKFSPDTLAKVESIMYLGNGYMGVRSATEEAYIDEDRMTVINGTFNRFNNTEVTELPNIADVTNIEFYIDNERFTIGNGSTNSFVRYLNLRTAELIRKISFVTSTKKMVEFEFRRFVSLDNLHVIATKVEIQTDENVIIKMKSGIDGQQTNNGVQHFDEGEKRVFDQKYLELCQHTTESDIDIVIHSAHKFYKCTQEFTPNLKMEIKRRQIFMNYRFEVEKDNPIHLEKISSFHTSIDSDISGDSLVGLKTESLSRFKEIESLGYDTLFMAHKNKWLKDVWNRYNVQLESEEDFDVLAIRFALYHLIAMTPRHDDRMGVAAKGLSGQGYKGHSFWDTEVFILPFFTFFAPEIARSLLMYRYHGLRGARQKAIDNNYQGAMYPWEMARPEDGETTPVWGAVDIITGEQTKIWSGFIEQHISSDIAFAVHQFLNATGQQDFIDKFGYEIIFETAKFWLSRLEWNKADGRYEINDVVGPDEYTEHADNNAFTNYMAHLNIMIARDGMEKLQRENQELYEELNERLKLSKLRNEITKKIDKIYLPEPNEDGVIPQDDKYLTYDNLDLSVYKQSEAVGILFDDYNLDQVNKMQVTKQADVVLLLLLLEQTRYYQEEITAQLKQVNMDYYEPRTTHDSSLSLSTHAIIASDLKDVDAAYNFFKRASEIDLGPYMHSSDEGIHAASIGGIMQMVLFGFAGVRLKGNLLTINPNLPDKWKYLEFTIYYQGQPINIEMDKELLTVKPINQEQISIKVNEKNYKIDNATTIKY
ncbi:glycoside hydrolase family 65 protein [Dolosigranulum pigrum]|uniref:glycoside hydrolase family 65 protein n=1 Tax=Dolosigranulum pigrum TaxID=29394 RepID=UPI000DBF927C|nr:glycosyl hydrolase family 65 protein [Dolosigranulum pigrum]RAN65095.1 family 65 glycosyl hydrolase [Dolosigranulum pigrum]